MRLTKADLEMRQMEVKIRQIEADLIMRQNEEDFRIMQIEAGFEHEAECARF